MKYGLKASLAVGLFFIFAPLTQANSVILNNTAKNKTYDVKCFSNNGDVIVKYEGVTKLSFKEAIMTFNDKDGNPHILTSQGICDYVQNRVKVSQ